jgi:DHA2 family multidrug resistance protein
MAHLSTDKQGVMQRIQQTQQSFIAKGMSPDAALKSSYKLMDLSVTKQASLLSYMDVFLYLGLMFLIFVPVVLIVLRSNKGAGSVDLSSAH